MVRRFIYAVGCLVIAGAVRGAQQTTAQASPLNVATALSQTATRATELDSLAAQIAQQIEKKHLKSVVVIGAVGRDASRLTQDGKEIGDEISAALTNRANGFQVVDRGALRDFLKKNGISEAMAVSDALAALTARISTVAGFVVIQIGEVSNGKVKLAANLYRSDLGDVTPLGTTKTELELSDEQKRVGFRPLDSDWNRPTIPIEDAKKLPPERSPKCSSCSGPHFPESIRQSVRSSGGDQTVGTYITVFADGTVGDIAIVKPAPFGLNEIVVGTIQKWHFKPAVDSEGKPMAFRSSSEMRFQMR